MTTLAFVLSATQLVAVVPETEPQTVRAATMDIYSIPPHALQDALKTTS